MVKARAKKTGFVHFILVENWIYSNAIHYISVWLRTGFYPPDINRILEATLKKTLNYYLL